MDKVDDASEGEPTRFLLEEDSTRTTRSRTVTHARIGDAPRVPTAPAPTSTTSTTSSTSITGTAPRIAHAHADLDALALTMFDGSTRACVVPAHAAADGEPVSPAWQVFALCVIDRLQTDAVAPDRSEAADADGVERLHYALAREATQSTPQPASVQAELSLMGDRLVRVAITLPQGHLRLRFDDGAPALEDEGRLSWADVQWLRKAMPGPCLPGYVLDRLAEWIGTPSRWSRSSRDEPRLCFSGPLWRPQNDRQTWFVQLDFRLADSGGWALKMATRQGPQDAEYRTYKRHASGPPAGPISLSDSSPGGGGTGSSMSRSRRRSDVSSDGEADARYRMQHLRLDSAAPPETADDGFMTIEAHRDLLEPGVRRAPVAAAIVLGTALGFSVSAMRLLVRCKHYEQGMSAEDIDKTLREVYRLAPQTLRIGPERGAEVGDQLAAILAQAAFDRVVVRYGRAEGGDEAGAGFVALERLTDGWRLSDPHTGQRRTGPAADIAQALALLYQEGMDGAEHMALCAFESRHRLHQELRWTHQALAREFLRGRELRRESGPEPQRPRVSTEHTSLPSLLGRIESRAVRGFTLSWLQAPADGGQGGGTRRWVRLLASPSGWDLGVPGAGWRPLPADRTLSQYVSEDVWQAGGRAGPVRMDEFEAPAAVQGVPPLYFEPARPFPLQGQKIAMTANVPLYRASLALVLEQPGLEEVIDAFGGSAHLAMWASVQNGVDVRVRLNENDDHRSIALELDSLDPDAVVAALWDCADPLKIAYWAALQPGCDGLGRAELAQRLAMQDFGTAGAAMSDGDKDAYLVSVARGWAAGTEIVTKTHAPALSSALKELLRWQLHANWPLGGRPLRNARNAALYHLAQYNSIPSTTAMAIKRSDRARHPSKISFGNTPSNVMWGSRERGATKGTSRLDIDKWIEKMCAAVIDSAAPLRNAVITTDDGWSLRAVRGQLLLVDPAYWLPPGGTPSNQGYGTEHLTEHSETGYLQLVAHHLRQSWHDGAWVQLNNRYSDYVQTELRRMGFDVSGSVRSSPRSNTDELVAINWRLDSTASVLPLLGYEPPRPLALREGDETGSSQPELQVDEEA